MKSFGLPFAPSLQPRVAELTLFDKGLTGFVKAKTKPVTYRLTVALSAVFPVPNRSYDTPRRGLMSFQLGTFSMAANERAPTNRVASADSAGRLLLK